VNRYREKKERERVLLSTLYVFGSTLLVFLFLFLFDLLKFEDFNEYTGPVKITFGSPLSEIDVVPEKQPTPEKIEEQPVEEEKIPEEILEEIESEVIESKSEEILNDKPKIEETKEVEPIKKVIKEPVKVSEPVVQKGRESGNSHETSFQSDSSKISRSGYFPIYQYMPLPKSITLDIYSFISGDVTGFGDKEYNRNFFNRYYQDRGSFFSLSIDVPMENRPDMWAILEAAGYKVESAEYKLDNSLRPVIIAFEINKNSNGMNAIKSAEIVSSSGVSEVDEAVLYGFKQSTYSNNTNESVKGRFKYSFK